MSKNEYRLEKDYAVLTIRSPKWGNVESKIDAAQIEDLKKHTWHAHFNPSTQSFYVRRTIVNQINSRKSTQTLHQYLLRNEYQANPGKTADHTNRNTLDNRRCNLQMKSHAEQMLNRRLKVDNTTGFRGVSFHRSRNKFQAELVTKNKNLFLGRYSTPELAAAAYNVAAVIIHGSSAQLNKTPAQLSEDCISKIKQKLNQ